MSTKNRFVTFDTHIPEGLLSPEHFRIGEGDVPSISTGEVLLHPLSFSIDPFQRYLLKGGTHHKLSVHELGKPLRGFAVARVVESRHDDYKKGNIVNGWMDWADYAIWPGRSNQFGLALVDKNIEKPSLTLNVLGITGLTAYFGIIEVGKIQRGETLVISSGAGGVGSIAGQIAKNVLGARVIGLTSSQSKQDVLMQKLGFDLALNYRLPDFEDQLQKAVPGGPNVYLDNVGGKLSASIMQQMRRPARVIECGLISTYNDGDNAWMLDVKPIHANGLRYEGYHPALFSEKWPQAYADLQRWMDEGKIIPLETELKGLESIPLAFEHLFTGKNIGKTIVTAEEL